MAENDKEHIWQEYTRLLPSLVEEFGLCNVIGGLANYVEELSYTAPEGGELEADLEFATVVLETATSACDLHYDEGLSTDRHREINKRQALEYLEEWT